MLFLKYMYFALSLLLKIYKYLLFNGHSTCVVDSFGTHTKVDHGHGPFFIGKWLCRHEALVVIVIIGVWGSHSHTNNSYYRHQGPTPVEPFANERKAMTMALLYL